MPAATSALSGNAKPASNGFAIAFSWERMGVSRQRAVNRTAHRAVRNDGREHTERTIMRTAMLIALAASARAADIGRCPGSGENLEDRHRGRLSALQQPDRRRQARGLRHRYRQGALRRDEGEVRLSSRRIGTASSRRFRPASSTPSSPRCRSPPERKREGRLHQQILQHAAGHRRAQGQRSSRA